MIVRAEADAERIGGEDVTSRNSDADQEGSHRSALVRVLKKKKKKEKERVRGGCSLRLS